MNKTVREWVAKAEGDFETAGVLSQSGERATYDAICYHAQQCIEKLMKASLISAKVVPPRTHDLVQLHLLMLGVYPTWKWSERELRSLSRFAVLFRYPRRSATKAEMRRAMELCGRLRSEVRALPGLQTPRPRKRRQKP